MLLRIFQALGTLCVMKYLIVIWFCSVSMISQVLGQDVNYYLTIVSSENKTVKEIHKGDQVRIIQFDSRLFKGQVTSIGEFDITIDTTLVSLKNIEKISTKKSWSRGVGGFFLAAGIGFMVAELATSTPESSIGPGDGAMAIIGLPLLIAGAAMVPPNYQQLGKSKWLVVMSKTPTVSR